MKIAYFLFALVVFTAQARISKPSRNMTASGATFYTAADAKKAGFKILTSANVATIDGDNLAGGGPDGQGVEHFLHSKNNLLSFATGVFFENNDEGSKHVKAALREIIARYIITISEHCKFLGGARPKMKSCEEKFMEGVFQLDNERFNWHCKGKKEDNCVQGEWRTGNIWSAGKTDALTGKKYAKFWAYILDSSDEGANLRELMHVMARIQESGESDDMANGCYDPNKIMKDNQFSGRGLMAAIFLQNYIPFGNMKTYKKKECQAYKKKKGKNKRGEYSFVDLERMDEMVTNLLDKDGIGFNKKSWNGPHPSFCAVRDAPAANGQEMRIGKFMLNKEGLLKADKQSQYEKVTKIDHKKFQTWGRRLMATPQFSELGPSPSKTDPSSLPYNHLQKLSPKELAFTERYPRNIEDPNFDHDPKGKGAVGWGIGRKVFFFNQAHIVGKAIQKVLKFNDKKWATFLDAIHENAKSVSNKSWSDIAFGMLWDKNAGPSGTTDELMATASLVGALQDPWLKASTRLCALANMVPYGHHSLIEVVLGAAPFFDESICYEGSPFSNGCTKAKGGMIKAEGMEIWNNPYQYLWKVPGPNKQTKHANVEVVADPKTGKLSIRKVTQTLLSNEEAPKSCMKGGCWYKEEIAKTYAAINKDVVEFIAEGQAPPTNVKDLENYVDPLMADPDAELLPGVNRLSKPASFAEAAKYQAKANSICDKLAAKYGNFWEIICGPANKIDYVAIKKSVKAKVKKAIVSRGTYASADGS